ncbi:hypothetical protein D9M72_540040 [compost metagenome]
MRATIASAMAIKAACLRSAPATASGRLAALALRPISSMTLSTSSLFFTSSSMDLILPAALFLGAFSGHHHIVAMHHGGAAGIAEDRSDLG